MVGRHLILAQPLAQIAGRPLGQAPCVHKDQRGPVLADQLGDPVVDLLPNLARHHRLQRRTRDLDPQVELTAVAFVNDHTAWRPVLAQPVVAHQEAGHLLDRPLRRRESDPRQGAAGQLGQPLNAQRQVRAAPVVGQRVDLVDDQRARRAQQVAAAVRGEQQVKRLGRGDQDVGRPPHHRLPLG